jgi:transcriptional regulator with PAS, ATPase and Fis domain
VLQLRSESRPRRSAGHLLKRHHKHKRITVIGVSLSGDEERLASGVCENAWDAQSRQIVAHYRRYGGRELVGKSAKMRILKERINRIASFPDARVLILGESGTGKETVALQIHNKSERKTSRFMRLIVRVLIQIFWKVAF